MSLSIRCSTISNARSAPKRALGVRVLPQELDQPTQPAALADVIVRGDFLKTESHQDAVDTVVAVN
jgi:hypothetical protein